MKIIFCPRAAFVQSGMGFYGEEGSCDMQEG